MDLGLDPDIVRLAEELAIMTGEPVAEAVAVAVRERLQRYRHDERYKRLMEIADRAAALPTREDFREENLYGPDGLPD